MALSPEVICLTLHPRWFDNRPSWFHRSGRLQSYVPSVTRIGQPSAFVLLCVSGIYSCYTPSPYSILARVLKIRHTPNTFHHDNVILKTGRGSITESESIPFLLRIWRHPMMPLHRRHPGDHKLEKSSGQNDDHKDRSAPKGVKLSRTTIKPYFWGCWLMIEIAALIVAFQKSQSARSMSNLFGILLTGNIVALPIFLALGVGLGVLGSAIQFPHQRFIPLGVVLSIVGNLLPSFLTSAFAALALIVFGLASRPAQTQAVPEGSNKTSFKTSFSLSSPLAAVGAAILMTTVLLTENFFVWVVSATYFPSQNMATLPSPLQDNGRLVMEYYFTQVLNITKSNVVTVRNMINCQWSLVSGLGLSLAAVELQGTKFQRNLWTLAIRGLLTMAIARSIRTVSFLITVLPSQSPNCYFSHFPYPPPKDWFSWLLVGFIPQSHGGCNDLIISGHATVTSTMACVITSIVGKPLFTTAMWMLVAMDYMVEIYEGFHYSVDMWLGALLVNFIWAVLAPIEEHRPSAPKRELVPLESVTRRDIILYALPAIGAYLQVTKIIPNGVANYTVVSYVLIAILQIAKFGFQHYTQHCLFCLLYMALGIYL